MLNVVYEVIISVLCTTAPHFLMTFIFLSYESGDITILTVLCSGSTSSTVGEDLLLKHNCVEIFTDYRYEPCIHNFTYM